MNRAQVYRWLGEEEKSIEIVNSNDWSASSDLFKMCSNVLLNKHKEAAELMKKIGSSSKQIVKANYKDWPIFKDFRTTEEFKTTYKELFRDEYEIVENES